MILFSKVLHARVNYDRFYIRRSLLYTSILKNSKTKQLP